MAIPILSVYALSSPPPQSCGSKPSANDLSHEVQVIGEDIMPLGMQLAPNDANTTAQAKVQVKQPTNRTRKALTINTLSDAKANRFFSAPNEKSPKTVIHIQEPLADL